MNEVHVTNVIQELPDQVRFPLMEDHTFGGFLADPGFDLRRAF